MSEAILLALGDGWLGKLIVGALCGAAAWFSRRPVEKAAVTAQVTKQVEMLFSEHAATIERLTKRCDALEQLRISDRAICDAELADMRKEILRLMQGPIASYGGEI